MRARAEFNEVMRARTDALMLLAEKAGPLSGTRVQKNLVFRYSASPDCVSMDAVGDLTASDGATMKAQPLFAAQVVKGVGFNLKVEGIEGEFDPGSYPEQAMFILDCVMTAHSEEVERHALGACPLPEAPSSDAPQESVDAGGAS